MSDATRLCMQSMKNSNRPSTRMEGVAKWPPPDSRRVRAAAAGHPRVSSLPSPYPTDHWAQSADPRPSSRKRRQWPTPPAVTTPLSCLLLASPPPPAELGQRVEEGAGAGQRSLLAKWLLACFSFPLSSYWYSWLNTVILENNKSKGSAKTPYFYLKRPFENNQSD